MRIFRDKSGISLVGVMVAVAAIGLTSSYLLSSQFQLLQMQKQEKLKSDFQTTTDRIQLLAGDLVGCTLNFGGINVQSNFSKLNSISGIYHRNYNSGTGKWEKVSGQPTISTTIDTLNGLKISKLQFLNPVKIGNSYTASLQIETNTTPKKSRLFPMRITIDEAAWTITDCFFLKEALPTTAPTIQLNSCSSRDAGWKGTSCASPSFVSDMYSNGGRWGGGDLFRCCQATAKNLPMADGTVQDVKITVGSPYDCTVVHDCGDKLCCMNQTQLRLNQGGIWAVSAPWSDGNTWEYVGVKQAKLSLPSNTHPRYQLAFKDCRYQGDANSTGWLCGQRKNGIVVDLYQTSGYCRDNCKPMCCELTINGP
jgi:hypothetical protein